MRFLSENRIWFLAQKSRKIQRRMGVIGAIFLAVALVGLFDGLLAQMRTGSNELEMLPGQEMTISGPVGVKNPLNSDVLARFSPDTAPLKFDLEGFFTGYWFGSGMWRGLVVASETADTGSYELRISFRGSSARGAQKYIIKVYPDREQMRAGSLSILKRLFDINPFVLASAGGLLGVLSGLITYYFGRRYARLLSALGLAEIYRANAADGSIWCLAPRSLAPGRGNARMIFDPHGSLVGEARAEEWAKGKLRLTMLDGYPASEGSLVCLVPPKIAENSQRGKDDMPVGKI